ncbi:MAG: hypothetical protein MN733_23410, partial [Nitrososphaera sp.]|nr:hypothetical protein [Nitrososphaera sp.]
VVSSLLKKKGEKGLLKFLFFKKDRCHELPTRSNAGHQARREAGAERTLYAVACMPWLDVPLVLRGAQALSTCLIP